MVFINYLNTIYIIQLGYPIVNKHVWTLNDAPVKVWESLLQLPTLRLRLHGAQLLLCTFLRIFMSSLHFLCLGLACWIADWTSPWVTQWDVSTAITKLFPHSTATWPVGQKKPTSLAQVDDEYNVWLLEVNVPRAGDVLLAMGISWVRFVKKLWPEGVGKIMGKNGWYWLGSLIVVNDG